MAALGLHWIAQGSQAHRAFVLVLEWWIEICFVTTHCSFVVVVVGVVNASVVAADVLLVFYRIGPMKTLRCLAECVSFVCFCG